jgi:hypothetical protein
MLRPSRDWRDVTTENVGVAPSPIPLDARRCIADGRRASPHKSVRNEDELPIFAQTVGFNAASAYIH